MLVEAVGRDELAGVHLVPRIPERLELAEGLHQLRAVHPRQQLAARLPVAVLARQRPAELHHEVGGLLHETAIGRDAFGGLQVEVDPGVHAALAEVAVERPGIAVLGHQGAQPAQIFSEARGRDGGVFPALPVLGFAGHEGGGAERRLAHGPHVLRLDRVAEERHRRRARAAAEPIHQPRGLRFGLRHAVGAELDVEPTLPFRQQGEPFQVQVLLAGVTDEQFVDALEADRAGRCDLLDRVGRQEDVRESQDEERPAWRAGDQPGRRFENGDAGAFGADQRPRDVEAVLRQQEVEVVARHSPRNPRELRAHGIAVPVADRRQARVDLTDPPALADARLEQRRWRRAHAHAQPVVGENVEFVDVVIRFARHHRVHAARVVADHPAERAPAVRRRVRPERQADALGLFAQPIEDDARLHPRLPARRVDCQDRVAVLREVEDDRDVAALPCQAGARPPREHRRPGRAAGGDGGDGILRVARIHHPNGHLAVIRRIGRIQGAVARVEAHLSPDRLR